MIRNLEFFREGVTTFRNIRGLAELLRNFFIEKANHAARHAPGPGSFTALLPQAVTPNSQLEARLLGEDFVIGAV